MIDLRDVWFCRGSQSVRKSRPLCALANSSSTVGKFSISLDISLGQTSVVSLLHSLDGTFLISPLSVHTPNSCKQRNGGNIAEQLSDIDSLKLDNKNRAASSSFSRSAEINHSIHPVSCLIDFFGRAISILCKSLRRPPPVDKL